MFKNSLFNARTPDMTLIYKQINQHRFHLTSLSFMAYYKSTNYTFLFLSLPPTENNMDPPSTNPYPGFDSSGDYYTPRKAPRIRPEASQFANKNAGSINLFSDEKHTHVNGPPPSPRCLTQEAKQNYDKGRKGLVSGLLGGGGPMPEPESSPAARYAVEVSLSLCVSFHVCM